MIGVDVIVAMTTGIPVNLDPARVAVASVEGRSNRFYAEYDGFAFGFVKREGKGWAGLRKNGEQVFRFAARETPLDAARAMAASLASLAKVL